MLTKLGQIKMVMHRAIKGTPKTAIVKRTPTGKWFVNITVELSEAEGQEKRLPPSEEEVGIDVGLKTFAYLSTEEEIANPRFFREDEAKLARAQRKLSKAPKGSREREKKRKVVACIHERIANRRRNFVEQEVSKLVIRFGFLAVEAIVVRNMVKNPKLAKSIADASWSMRVYECHNCGLVIHRDYNGSLNILADARQAVGRHSRVIPEAPGAGAMGSRHNGTPTSSATLRM